MARTLVTGNILRSGSIPTTALGGGVVTSSLQIVASLPTGSLSSSAQVNYPDISNIPGGIASSSAQIKDYLPTGTVSSSTQLPSGIASSSAQVTAYLPTGTVSSSGQISVFNTINGDQLATTGSNTFTAPQTISDTTNSTSYLDGALHIAGGMSVRKDVRISGSMTINGLLTAVSMSTQYVTSSEYVVGTSRITLNDDDNVRFAGLSIIDSGSSSPTSASIFWDSLNHHFIYENLSGSAYNSAIIIAGPKHTGTLGDEPTLTSGYITVATGTDHIDNSVMFQSASNIGIGTTTPSLGTLQINGNVHATSYTGSISGSSITANTLTISGTAGASIARINATQDQSILSFTDTQDNTGYFSIRSAVEAGEQGASFFADGALFFGRVISGAFTERTRIDSSGNVGIGTTNPGSKLQVNGQVRIINGSGNNPGGYLWIEDQNGLTYSATSENTPSLTVKNEQGGANRVSTLRLSARDSGGGLSNWNISSIGVGSDRGILAIQNGNVERMRIDSSGYILVNATSSIGTGDSRLQVGNGSSGASTQLLLKTTAGHSALYSTTSSNTYLTWASGGFFALGIAPADGSTFTEYMRIGTTGNVGIGTTNPGVSLDIDANGTGGTVYTVYVRNTSTSTSVYNVIRFLQGATGAATGIIGTGGSTTSNATFQNTFVVGTQTAHSFVLASNDTGRVWINSAGNVGIGTTDPEARLDIIGATQGTITTLGSEVPGLIVQQRLTSDSNGNAGPMIDFRTSNGADVWTQGAIATIAAGTYAGQMAFYTQPGGTTDTTGRRTKGASLVERMRINESGNVGIGTTNPNSLLEVYKASGTNYIYTSNGTANTFNGLMIRYSTTDYMGFIGNPFTGETRLGGFNASGYFTTIYSNNAETMRITAGNVGIGTTNPASLLHVKASGNYGTIISDNSTNQGGGAFGVRKNGSAIGYLLNKGSWYGDTSNDLCLSAESGYNVRIYTDGSASEKFIFTAGGNFGINTTSPGEKLEVNGSVYVNAEDSGFIIDAGGLKRVGLMKLAGHEGNIVRASGQDFGITRASTSNIKDATSLVYDVYVDGSGRVTKQNQPAFLVYSAGFSVTGGTWQIISDDLTSVSYNIGSHFNTSNGRFTAPVAGRYYFYAGGWAASTSEGSRYAMSATINGGSQLYLTGGDYCNVDSPLAGYAVTFNLNANDYVELQCFTAVSTQWGGGHYLYFGGYLLG